jgi:hypothetical protein
MVDPPLPFPSASSLCERCGYALQGLPRSGVCPECGKPIAESDPVHRTGLPWQLGMTLRAWLITTAMVLVTPGRAFDLMRVGGNNVAAKTFMLTHATLGGLIWLVGSHLIGRHRGMVEGLWVTLAIVTMTLIAALGVTYFSWRQGWRVPWRLAYRITCYAAPGWLPAVVVVGAFAYLDGIGVFEPLLGRFDLTVTLIAYAALLGVSMLGFETLVWLGARRTRFANAGD